MSGQPISLDDVRGLATRASEWMPGDPWAVARQCYPASIAYVAGWGVAHAPPSASEAFGDNVTPAVVLALVEAVEAAQEAAEAWRTRASDSKRTNDALDALAAALARFTDHKGTTDAG